MKKAILSSILLLSTTSIFAQTTMCFKENHNSMSTIESIPLNGGACEGKNSISQMKTLGWNVDDIKISQGQNGMNYIYVLKKHNPNAQATQNVFLSRDELRASYQQIQKEEEIKKEILTKANQAEAGKTYYINKCQSCHGENGEKEAYGSSVPLRTLSAEDMTVAISAYQLDSKNNGNGHMMKAIANTVVENDLVNIAEYLKSINK